MAVDLLELFWTNQARWSQEVFGPDFVRGPIGPTRHLAREVLTELLGIDRSRVDDILGPPPHPSQTGQNPELEEYIDCQFLIIDAARRAGYSYDQYVNRLFKKLDKNLAREWPPFDPAKVNDAVEHVRKEGE